MFLKSSLQDAENMRTNQQHETSTWRDQMKAALKSFLFRSSETLVQDAAGLASLVVLLVVGLHLPGIV
jgi:hypothetical protein